MHTLEQSALNTNSMEQQISGRCRKECNSGDIPESQGVTELCFQMATARTSHKILVCYTSQEDVYSLDCDWNFCIFHNYYIQLVTSSQFIALCLQGLV